MNQIYTVSLDNKKRTADLLVYLEEYSTSNLFPQISALCDLLGVGNKKRSMDNFSFITAQIARNSYVTLSCKVRNTFAVQAGGCIGFIGRMKDEADTLIFESTGVHAAEAEGAGQPPFALETAVKHFNLPCQPTILVDNTISIMGTSPSKHVV
eukprot:TRINITY_DN749_c0_g1_i4.p1 TRINITY_DN749_c0_g1~~TRINITY_DN749_c0_g1_i4.p1  ORF type:complete len:153 (-),score=23.38 TRINITY_DN749_c0_g1_i4:201-659(-)